MHGTTKITNTKFISVSRRGHTQTKVDAQAVFFFAGECTNETTKLEIRHNFITAVNSSLYSVICKREPSCHADAINVQVINLFSYRRMQ